jgi:class 3 adenylate cyclase
MDGGDVRYAVNAGVSIAYQVFGSGPRDLVFVCGTMSHLELWWSDPLATQMLERLARFARVIVFDKPGTGLSDPVPAAPTVDQRTNDLVAVMDAASSERAVLLGFSEGGVPTITLAATQPERVEALVLASTWVAADWHPGRGLSVEPYDRVWAALDAATDDWGKGLLLQAMAPTWAANPVYRKVLGSIERACMSPGMARSVLQGTHGIDLLPAAQAVRVPTLVLHSPDEQFIRPEMGEELARVIDGATLRPLRGPDHLLWIHNSELLPEAIEEFLTGVRPHRDDDRVMTTVVFTDIVGSTRRLAELGDASWTRVLQAHDARMDQLLEIYGGESVNHTGDGRMARFARPARALRFASAMSAAAPALGLEIRIGVHTGECELVGADVRGLTVTIAARVAALAGAGEVLTTSTVRDLVIGSGLGFVARGEHELKGVPGTWQLLACVEDLPGPLVASGYDTDVRHPAGLAEPPTLGERAIVAGARRAPGALRRVLRVANRR